MDPSGRRTRTGNRDRLNVRTGLIASGADCIVQFRSGQPVHGGPFDGVLRHRSVALAQAIESVECKANK